MSDIYYSQVNKSLQTEIIKRAEAGSKSRTTKDLRFMLEQVANAELVAYESANITKDSTPIPASILGGETVLGDSFMPNGPTGFLSRPVHRTRPYLTNVSISINDQSRGFINKATVSITIPDPGSDLDEMESIYCVPGRAVRLKIQHPESAVMSEENKLVDDELTSFETLKSVYPNLTDDEIRAMNAVTFNGKISTFSFSFKENGSVELSLEMLGATGTYINVSAYVSEVSNQLENTEKDAEPGTTNNIVSFYDTIYQDITKRLTDAGVKTNGNEINTELIVDNKEYQSILVGTFRSVNNNNSTTSAEYFISVGMLVYYINTYLLKKIEDGTTPEIVCTDDICRSIYYEKIVSADPTKVLLWPGKGKTKTNVYPASTDYVTEQNSETNSNVTQIVAYSKVIPVTSGFNVTTDDQKVAYPARIYVNISIIKDLLASRVAENKEVTVKDILNTVSLQISSNTGRAYNLKLIQDPIAEKLLFYDTNFKDPSREIAQEFEIPTYMSEVGITAVRSMTLTTRVPESIKSMIYGLSSGITTTQQVGMYSPYVFATPEVKEEIKQKHAEEHRQAVASLEKSKYTYAAKPNRTTAVPELREAVAKYVTYYTEDIEESIKATAPAFPMEAEITMDGINGFKYGDVLNLSGIPRKYRDTFVFMVINITHDVSEQGDWSTKLKLLARVRL